MNPFPLPYVRYRPNKHPPAAYLVVVPLLLACICGSPSSRPADTPAPILTEVSPEAPAPRPTASEPNLGTPSPPASIPTATALAPGQGLIVDTVRVIDYPLPQVEALLGPPTEVYALGIGEAEEVPDGGETRTYLVGVYTIWVNYDKAGIAKGLQVVDGLAAEGYSLDDWPLILGRMNIGYVGFPDVEAPAARRWNNALGYWIMIAAASIDGDVWTVRIYKIPE